MPLTAPNLDDRQFDDIVRDLQLRIPVYTRAWTDFNDSDPGMALLQLFAWLTETTLFRLNQVPARNYVKFLQLLGFERKPAAPAVTHVTFEVTPGLRAGPVRKGAQVSAQDPVQGAPLVFETERGLDLVQASLTDVWVFEGSGFADVSEANLSPGTSFRPLGWMPQPGNALYLGFAPPTQPVPYRIFPPATTFRVFAGGDALETMSHRCPPVWETRDRTPAPAGLVWEYRPAEGVPWRRLNLLEDETGGFTRAGYVRIEGPDDIEPTRGPEDVRPSVRVAAETPRRFWLRCRLDRLTADESYAPTLESIQPNTVEVRQLTTVRDQELGESDGVPDQVFRLRRIPVFVTDDNRDDPITLRSTLDAGDDIPWSRVDDFLASGPDDRHYVLDEATGTVRFGDGERGRIPEPSSFLVAREYRTGGGAGGNRVKARMIDALVGGVPGVSKVTNWADAVGGRDEESVDALRARAPQQLRARDRAVTTADFESIARDVGGVAKAVALANWHPEHPGVDVPGAVTVVLLPTSDGARPVASDELVEEVCRRLNAARLVTTEIHVARPAYVGVRVEAKVEARPRSSFDAVATAVKAALDAFLSPYGETRGFGTDLVPTRLFDVIQRASPDVAAVPKLVVYIDGRFQELSQRVELPPDGLLFSDRHTIVVVPEENR